MEKLLKDGVVGEDLSRNGGLICVLQDELEMYIWKGG